VPGSFTVPTLTKPPTDGISSDDDESGTSGSDYGQAREVKQAERRKKVERGHEASDTESEDARLDRELSGEAASEHGDSPPRTRPTKTAKKSRKVTGADDEEAVGSDEEDADEAERPLDQNPWAATQGGLGRSTGACPQSQQRGGENRLQI